MISVMNGNDFELDRKTDIIGGESQANGRVSVDRSIVRFDIVVNADGNRRSSSDSLGSEDSRVSAELENRALGTDRRLSVRGDDYLDSTRSEKTRVSDWRGVDEEMKPENSDTRYNAVRLRVNDHKFVSQTSGTEEGGSGFEKVGVGSEENGLVQVIPRASEHKVDVWNGGVEHSRSGMGPVGVGNGKAVGDGLTASVGYGYQVGDMVWGKVKSHPWWPGRIYNEAFASPSVRRSKREGHVLVAFFGDSSYGWFEPAELIPFCPNFSEKSTQTKSTAFVKAVEEAVDEASRRHCLGLACRCRNQYNFRPTNVQGYVAVDMDGYEPGAVYSLSQIRSARDSFQPRDTLAFMKQLSLRPKGDGHRSIGFVMNMSTLLAYRKAVYEEFDETYAQAFGKQPVRPTRDMELVTQPIIAPLSGPLVIAEALGKRKKSTKSSKAKDQADKDKYLFKRRDEPNELKIQQIEQGTTVLPAYVEGSMEIAAGEYVLQKRPPPAASIKHQIPAKLEQMVVPGIDASSAPSVDATGERILTMGEKPPVAKSSMAELVVSRSKVAPPAISAHSSGLSWKGVGHGEIENGPESLKEGDMVIDVKNDRLSATTSKLVEGYQQPPSLATVSEEVPSCGNSGHVLPATDAKLHAQNARTQVGSGVMKPKPLKRPFGEPIAEKSTSGEKEKKKKRKKETGMEVSSDRMQQWAAAGKSDASAGGVTGKPVQVGVPSWEDHHIKRQKKDDGANNSMLSATLGKQLTVGKGNSDFMLSQLLNDLQALALNPFHVMERNSSATAREAFLKFRSLVYQKSLALSTPGEMESIDVHAPKTPAGSTAGSDNPPRENIADLLSPRPPKPAARPNDPTKGGRKRGPSDRQEESAAKRMKKISDIKSLQLEKKTVQKTPEAQRDGKETVAPRPSKPLKADPVKKMASPARTREPTVLVIKFPPGTTLPSVAELKFRLARFGSLDHTQTRVFWKSSQCKAVFIYRVDAEAAHRHLTGRNTLFGNVSVRCNIRPVEATEPEPESKVQREDTPEQKLTAVPRWLQPVGQLKSCLKKPTGDEAGTAAESGGNGGSNRGNPRVKFVLGGGERIGGGEQLMVGNKNNNFNNATSFADGGASSSSSSTHGMDFNNNFQKVFPPAASTLPPLPPTRNAKFPNAPMNERYAEAAPPPPPRNTRNLNAIAAPAVVSSTNVDIAPQMLSLLVKCNDVVSNLRSFLGYVPYHPL